ncbi:MAG: PRC-barrel domain-containing protein [Thermomicrobiales bacterium]
MNIRIGKHVVSRDGTHIGKVDHLALDADAGKLLAIVVRSGVFYSNDRLIEPGSIDYVESDGSIHLRLTTDQARNLPIFIKEEYVSQEDPDLYPTISTPLGILWPASYATPHFGEYGEDKEFFETAQLDPPTVEVVSNLPADATEVGHRVHVVGSDNRGLGHVAGVRVEPHGAIESIIVESGHLGFHHESIIPWSDAKVVTHERVTLSLTSSESREQARAD